MNTKRITFWASFIIVLGLIIWGLVLAANKPVNTSKVGTPAPISATDNIQGPANAKVTVIEYGDFQCPACAQYYPLVTRVMNDASTTARLVFRHFPLTQHPNAIPSAMAAEAAGVQGAFWGMYSLLYENQTEWADTADPTSIFIGYAKKLNLDTVAFKGELTDKVLTDKINADRDESLKLGLNGTPSFFINGKFITNPTSYESFKALIDAAAASATK